MLIFSLFIYPNLSPPTSASAQPQPEDEPYEQGMSETSSDLSSDSDSESDAEDTSLPTSAIIVKNEKSHVVHAARITSESCSKRSCFTSKGKTFEFLCGSSVVDSPTQAIAMIPHGSKICQRKACLAVLDHFLK